MELCLHEPRLLLYGDSLPLLRTHVADETVDLIYLDPPGEWRQWSNVSEAIFLGAVRDGGRVGRVLRALRIVTRDPDTMGLLAMLAACLVECHRVLRSTGSMFMHCPRDCSP